MRANIFRVLSLLLVAVSLFLGVFTEDSHFQKSNSVELVTSRTEGSKTWELGDGKYALDAVLGAIHYKNDYNDAQEQWKEIDTTIVDGKIKKAPYTLSIDGYEVTVRDKKTGAVTTVKLDDIDGERIANRTPIYKGNTATFENVAKDTDIEITATNSHIYFKRVLKSADAPLTATFAVNQVGDSIRVTPYARERSSYTDIKVVSTFKDGKLTETIEQFKVASLEYPIEIDPTIDVWVSASTDDAQMYWNGGAWAFDNAYIYNFAGYGNAAVYKSGVGIRFANITIPYGSTITLSYINITCAAATATTTVNTTIIGNKQLNAATFANVADFQARRGTIVGGANNNYITAQQVAWDAIAAWTVNTTYQSPNITAVTQEIINQVGWASGNAMAYFWDDFDDRSTHAVGAYRVGWSYNGTGVVAQRPLLHIEYTSVTGPTLNTLRCTGFGQNWLLFNGNVTSYGANVNITQLGFDYGQTTSYGSTAETAYTNYTMTSYGYYTYVSGLNAQTMYHYRANAFNGAWGYGGDRWFSTAGTLVTNPMEWESHVIAVNATTNVYGANWVTQRFTTNATAHTLSQIDLWLSRIGSPGDVSVEIQQAGSDGLPYGTVLVKGTIPGAYTGNLNPVSTNTTARYPVALTPAPSLAANTTYCVTVKALGGDYTNYLRVGMVSPYIYGQGYSSSNNGITWADVGQDFLFDLWGFSCLQVDYAKVFNTYKSTGDWLMVFFYRNTFPPYYPINDAKQYFAYQLVDQYNVVKAQSACQEWGAKPGSIYLSAATVSGLQWSGQYRIRLVNVQSGAIYMEYLLQSADWAGTDLSILDSWVLSMAQQLQLYDGVPYITSITGRGNVLNASGGVIFATGIPLLDSVRPNLFQVVSQPGAITSSVYPQTLRQTFQPAAMLGPDAFAAMTSIGNVFGTDGRTIGAAGLIIIVLVIAGWGFQPGHTVAATVICMPIFIIGMMTGLIDLLIGAIGLAIAVITFLWQAVFRGG